MAGPDLTFVTETYQIVRMLVAAGITLLAGFVAAKLMSKIARRVFAEAELDRILKASGFKQISDMLAKLIEYVLYIVTILIVLQQLGFTQVIIGILIALVVAIVAFSRWLGPKNGVSKLVNKLKVKGTLKKL